MIKPEIVFTGSYYAKASKISINNKSIVTPIYFPSISGTSARFDTKQLIDICINSNYPRILISAFDLFRFSKKNYEELKNNLQVYSKQNIIFLDSGTFEKYWLQDNKWSFHNYEIIIKNISNDFFATYDNIGGQSGLIESMVDNTFRDTLKSSQLSNSSQCITICHGTPEKIPEIIAKVAMINPEYCYAISIPERECGRSIEIRIDTIRKVRRILHEKNIQSFIHVLGCGNPISMILFTLAGADSFDSIDWSRWLINNKTCQFQDLTHISLVECDCNACKIQDLDLITKALYHNLLFYQNFFISLRNSIKTCSEFEFMRKYLDKQTIAKIVKLFNNKKIDYDKQVL